MTRPGVYLSIIIAAAHLAPHAFGGIRADGGFALPNGDFSAGLFGWTQRSSDGADHFAPSAGPLQDRSAVRALVPAGEEARLSLALPIGSPGAVIESIPAMGELGEKIELGAWIYLSSDCAAGEIFLQAISQNGTTQDVIAESVHAGASAPRNVWFFLPTRPVNGFDARIQSQSSALQLVARVTMNGTVFLDDVSAGLFEYGEYPLVAGSFEDASLVQSAWTFSGGVRLDGPSHEPDAYYGVRSLVLTGHGPARARQLLAFDASVPSPHGGQTVEAGAWVRLDEADGHAAQASSIDPVELHVLARRRGASAASAVEIAERRWFPRASERGRWIWLETLPTASPELSLDTSEIILEIEKSGRDDLHVDFVQVGERHAIHGAPKKQVSCNYVGRFRSPLFPGTSTSPTDPRAMFGTWCWMTPPSCDPAYTALFHDPDCATSTECLRANGRRNVAVSTEHDIDDVPLVGAYDSRDKDVIRYHVHLASAIGIDNFIFDYHGHSLAQQKTAQGTERLNEEAFEALLDVAEEPGNDLKVAVMYEPKVHFLGWVQGEPSLVDKKTGIESDLVLVVDAYARRKAALKLDGHLVVFVFDNHVCNPAGDQCLSDLDWQDIEGSVEAATGERLFLVADDVPSVPSPFQGLSRWSLVVPSVLEYASFPDFVSRHPANPAPAVAQLDAHADLIGKLNAQWSAQDDAQRLSVSIVWPGFDDSGVGGWSDGNMLGSDGQALCVRVASSLGGQFYATTVHSALDREPDWIQIATWNDWNEWTQIEPTWNVGYASAVLSSVTPNPLDFDRAFHRALETQAWIAAFKGVTLSPQELHRVAAQYLRSAAADPSIVEYD